MQPNNEELRTWLSRDLTDTLIRLAVVAFLVVVCVRVFEPFIGLMLWALILAVALYPLHRRIVDRFGLGQGKAATALVLVSLLLVGGPTVMLSSSFAEHIYDVHTQLKDNQLTLPQPAPAVAEWPIVGKKLYETWSGAAQDLPAYLEKIKPQLVNFSKTLVSIAASMAGGVFQFLGSLIVAGIMMAYGQSGSAAMQRIITRLAGPDRGPGLHTLSTATIRSVATGVVGVAFIQALLLGIGFIWAGIPGAGVLAVVVLLFGIAQLPVAVISLPVIAYVWWSGDSTLSNTFFTIYFLLAGFVDNVLKPLLLGRGVDAPMPVVLLGALGGMVAGGIIGLFVGAVVLAVGYQIFMRWVDAGVATAEGQVEGKTAPGGA